jgi:enamine deaminase RidA (YjgF/YER057c/UK114 family)
MTKNRQHISSGSPYEASIGFSRAVRGADRVIVSGTAPIWADGSCDPDPEVQAKRCLEIIFSALADAGATGGDVIRTRMFIADRADADAVAQAHGQAFTDVRPASSMIVVSGFLDARWRVEIEAEAVVG